MGQNLSVKSRKGDSMNTEHLRYFITTVETGSYAEAARILFITPEGVSKAIKTLEKDSKKTAAIFDQLKMAYVSIAKQSNSPMALSTCANGQKTSSKASDKTNEQACCFARLIPFMQITVKRSANCSLLI